MQRYFAVIICLLQSVALAGCGQKGALFLPGDPSDIQTEVPAIESGELPPANEEPETGDNR